MLVEKLPQEDIELITAYRDWFATSEDMNGSAASSEYILRLWDDNKQNYLWNMFGKQFILQKDIQFTKDAEMMEDELNDNIYNSSARGAGFIKEFRSKFCKYEDSFYDPWDTTDPLAREKMTLDEEKQADIVDGCRHLVDYDSLGNNIYCGNDFAIPFPDGTMYKVNHGCKTSRALGKIAAAFKIAGYEEFRLAHSLALNQKVAKGTLCLSIHPLDYMTMSDNECGWDSCMSWMNEGSYRIGTVEMMNSTCVVVAYLKSDTDMQISNSKFCWNNKKWRELFIVRPECLVNIMGYPYHSKELEIIVLNWLKELASTNLGWNNWAGDSQGNPIEFSSVDVFTPTGMDHSIRLHAETCRMYNDFRSTHRIYVNPDLNSDHILRFNYSGPSECMWCGAEDPSFDEDGDLCCYSCMDSTKCDGCGERWDGSDLCEIDGMWLCPDCIDNYCKNCDVCNEMHNEDYMKEFFIIPKLPRSEVQLSSSYGLRLTICKNCLDRLICEGLIEKAELKERSVGWVSQDYLFLDDISDIGAKILSYNDKDDLEQTVLELCARDTSN